MALGGSFNCSEQQSCEQGTGKRFLGTQRWLCKLGQQHGAYHCSHVCTWNIVQQQSSMYERQKLSQLYTHIHTSCSVSRAHLREGVHGSLCEVAGHVLQLVEAVSHHVSTATQAGQLSLTLLHPMAAHTEVPIVSAI